YQHVIGLEVDAVSIDSYEVAVVHGLAQTGAYAQALIEAASFGTRPDEEIDRLVAVRLDRQRKVLHRPDPPQITLIIDESALRRRIPIDQCVLRDQLQHLVHLAELPHLTLRVLPANLF